MSALDELRADVISHLQVTSEIITMTGGTINVGENFTARFTVRNTDTAITFLKVKLTVFTTECAALLERANSMKDPTPAHWAGFTQELATTLEPGRGVHTDFRFRALKCLDRWEQGHEPPEAPTGKPRYIQVIEQFAELRIRASVESAAFLGELSRTAVASTDILEGGTRS